MVLIRIYGAASLIHECMHKFILFECITPAPHKPSAMTCPISDLGCRILKSRYLKLCICMWMNRFHLVFVSLVYWAAQGTKRGHDTRPIGTDMCQPKIMCYRRITIVTALTKTYSKITVLHNYKFCYTIQIVLRVHNIYCITLSKIIVT